MTTSNPNRQEPAIKANRDVTGDVIREAKQVLKEFKEDQITKVIHAGLIIDPENRAYREAVESHSRLGGQVEFQLEQNRDGHWELVPDPFWNWDAGQYRIVPPLRTAAFPEGVIPCGRSWRYLLPGEQVRPDDSSCHCELIQGWRHSGHFGPQNPKCVYRRRLGAEPASDDSQPTAGPFEIRITRVSVAPPGECIFGSKSTSIEIDDEGGGEFLRLKQHELTPELSTEREITLNPEEWPMIKSAIDQFIERGLRE